MAKHARRHGVAPSSRRAAAHEEARVGDILEKPHLLLVVEASFNGLAQQLERRLRAHYETVLGHAQAQVAMALKLNDEADARWLAEVVNRQSAAAAIADAIAAFLQALTASTASGSGN